MLRLIYEKGTIFDEIKLAARKGIRNQILIVPQHYSHEAERMLCETCGDSISLYCEVLTLKRLANRVFGEYGGLAEQIIEEGGRILVMSLAARAVASSLKAFAGQLKKPAFLESLVSLIDEFKTHGVTAEMLAQTAKEHEGSLGEKISDLSLLYGAYEAILHNTRQESDNAVTGDRKAYRDPPDLYTLLLDKLTEGEYAAGKTIYIEGFTEFTPQEMRIVEVLLCKANSLTVSLDLDSGVFADVNAEDLLESPFYGSIKTLERLRRIASARGHEINEIKQGEEEGRTEFSNSNSACSALSFLRRHLFGGTSKFDRNECKEIALYTAENPWNECEQAASEILRLCKEEHYRFGDIIVAAPDYSSYAGMLEAVFESWDIPLFSDRMDNIMQKPVMAAVEAAIDVVLGGFEYRDVFRYLKTGLPGLSYDECCKLENYVLAWNIKGRQWSSGSEWTMNPKGFSVEQSDKLEQELAILNRLRLLVINPFLRFLKRVPAGKELPASGICTAFYEFLLDAGFDRIIEKRREEYIKRGERKLAEEYAQLWGMLCEVLDTTYQILQETPMDFEEFSGMLRLLLSSMEVGTIPISIDSVAAGDAGRMRHRSAKCVILLGACNGAFPPPNVRNSLLTDENRVELLDLGIQIEPPSARLLYRELEVAYSILTLPREKLIVSWPINDHGTQCTPSYLIDRIRAMFSLRVTPPMGEERLTYAEKPCFELALQSAGSAKSSALSQAAFQLFEENGSYTEWIEAAQRSARSERPRLSDHAVKQLYGDKIILTASKADKLRSCKYAYFMQYGLRAKPRFKAGLDALESGSFLHYVLEGTIKTVMARGGFEKVTDEEIRNIADDLSSIYSTDVLGGMGDKSARVRFLYRKLKRTAIRVVENVAEELRNSEFKPLGFELEFGENGEVPAISTGDANEEIELTGIVDRVDGWEKDGKLYIRVVDYKSGFKKFDLTDIWHGLSLQMLIYLFALEERGKELYGKETVGAGVLYIPAKDAVHSGSRGMQDAKIREKTDEALRRSGLVLKSTDVVEAMENGRPKRFLPVSFARSGSGYSDSASLASLEQLGKLKQHVDMLLRQMGRALHEGAVEADPYYRDLRSNACTYCEFFQACRFDVTNGKDRMRYLYKLKHKEFWTRLGVSDDADSTDTGTA